MLSIYSHEFNISAIWYQNKKWEDATVNFETPKDGVYIIAITAIARNYRADDDLHIAINQHQFGAVNYQNHRAYWRTLNKPYSWNGSKMKGNAKTNYYILPLMASKNNVITFFANWSPTLEKVDIFLLKSDLQIKNIQPKFHKNVNREGIPFACLNFWWIAPQTISISAEVHSARSRQSTHDDKIKIINNGKIISNPLVAPNADKYKNFYFSGDLLQGVLTECKLKTFNKLENTLELWGNGKPCIQELKITWKNLDDDFSQILLWVSQSL